MEQDQQVMEPDLGMEVLQNMGLFLLGRVLGDQDASFEAYNSGNITHLLVRNCADQVVAHVVGKNTGELGDELALAVLHDVTVEQLRSLQRMPLNKPLRVEKGNVSQ